MADETEGSPERGWLRPPEPGEVRIDIAVDEEAELTPEVRSALDRLARSLEEGEVQGYAKPGDDCKGYVYCGKRGSCRPFVKVPNCAKWTNCKIVTD